MLKSSALATLLAALAVLVTTQAANAQSQTVPEVETTMTSIDHAQWTALLQDYIIAHTDGVNRFDYGALKADREDMATLNAYIAGFATVDFSALASDEAFAAWANLYNALTIQHVVGRYPIRSIRSGTLFGPWKRVKTIADGREVSLDDIEHNILREEWDDPRVHYAINCAAIGCPNLRARAWEVDTLDDDLNGAAHDYVNHARGVSIHPRGGLVVSSIYHWFEDDFGASEDAVIAHFLEYAEPELAAQIDANRNIRRHDYDWNLNDVD